jgi:hypothetical protein
MSKRTPAKHDKPTHPPTSALAPITPRVTTDVARSAPADDDRISEFLDSSELAETVPLLRPETLHLLIRHHGLAACTGLVAAATPRQLNAVLDIDLWQPAHAGEDDKLDVQRFGEWLETLCEAGAPVAAAAVAAMDTDMVAAALSAYIRVMDSATLAPSSEDGEWTDVASLGGLTLEVGGYVVVARAHDAWDAIVSLLVALAEEHPRGFRSVMRGCRRLSNSVPEVDGLDDLLMAPEQLLHDLAVNRLHRRSHKGYVAPADARAFLQLARQRGMVPVRAPGDVNPIAAAYLKPEEEEDQEQEQAPQETVTVDRDPPHGARERAEQIEAAAAALSNVEAALNRPRALPGSSSPEPPRLASIHALLQSARDAGHFAFAAHERELAFLANALAAGCPIVGRTLTNQEASEAVLATCNLGLEHRLERPQTSSSSAAAMHGADSADRDLVSVFEAGWAVLHRQVSMFVAEQLIATLAATHSHDTAIQEDLQALKRELEREWRNGTPWKAGHALEVIAILDQPIWVSLIGVFSECPVIPAALSATVERRTGAISASAFEFISTSSQIRQVQAFMLGLGELLVR